MPVISQTPLSFAFDVSSSQLESHDDNIPDSNDNRDIESEDELSESEIVDMPSPWVSTAASKGTISPKSNLERSLNRSWSKRRLDGRTSLAAPFLSPSDVVRASEAPHYGTF